jgi:hypothetical protein
MTSTLSRQGQALLEILVSHLRKPGVNAQRPETLIGYGEALELLKLPANAPRGPTDGKTLQLNGLNDLAQWVNRHPRMPRITGMIISRSEYDGIDGIRRPRNVPSAGYFREYKRKTDDWQWWIEQVEASLAFDWSPLLSTPEQPEARFPLPTPTRFEHLRPTRNQRVYDLLQEAGLKTEILPGDAQGNGLAAHRSYLSQWSFIEGQRIVLCLHFQDIGEDGGAIFQRLNYRTAGEEHRHWNTFQKQRAWSMDRAFVTAYKSGRNVRVIVVDGERDAQGDEQVKARLLDPESWHVSTYDKETGWCRLQRGPQPAAPETFTTKEIEVAGTFAEGAQSEVTAKTRERSARLRDLARAHFITHSADGRLHCAICTWAPPLSLALSGPIVEIHHGIGVSQYPTGGRALTFEEAIQHLTPLCPNCHRITHAKPGGGTFTLAELQKARI